MSATMLEQPPVRVKKSIFRPKVLMAALQHGYIWIWLIIFVTPFVTTILQSLKSAQGSGMSRTPNLQPGCFA